MTYKSSAEHFEQKAEEHRDKAEKYALNALEAISASEFAEALTYLHAAIKSATNAKVNDEKAALMWAVAEHEE